HRIDYEWPISKDYAEEKLQYIKAYVDNLPQETQSLTTGTSDSGLGAQAGPSELEEDLKAAAGSQVSIIETMLSRGIDVNSKDSFDDTPLLVAASFGKIAAAHFLLKRGADAFAGFTGRDVLHHASLSGSVTLIDTVLSFGVDVNSKDDNGLTTLQLAQKQRKTEAVNFLLSKGGR
ncbi:2-5A-dependent ribonuclease-like, partial [Stylophora pistillata]|uniref:2-5A-dependent ribonuclease-like n=1 Tax=Stylophora pistillata TaxID=50429 RepID=UPI000C042CDD